MGVKCLTQHMGIAVAVIVGIRSSGKGCGGIRRGAGSGERDRECRHESSKEEAAVGGGWLAFGGLDTHSV